MQKGAVFYYCMASYYCIIFFHFFLMDWPVNNDVSVNDMHIMSGIHFPYLSQGLISICQGAHDGQDLWSASSASP
ncbi:hypothetical protein L208DRAFT_731352 [Tricholoma matsutake]|nr:hypothetical protein L208DRAFT_731352 [Tricholoma matsutake 945]